MKKLFICLIVCAASHSFAQRHKHFDRKEMAGKRSQRAIEDLNDYVPSLSPTAHDSIEKYFTAYYGNAMTYSPTSKVRKKSRVNLDNRVKKLLNPNEFAEYQVFMKDLKKKQQKKSHHKHHDFAHFRSKSHDPKENRND
jgi:hypothetical protein